MKEMFQAGAFYNGLEYQEKSELCETLAENIFFLEDELQKKILVLLDKVDEKLGEEIRKRNNFTS